MTDAYEKLGAFYLGKNYDLDGGKLLDELLLYDSKDLTTHGVCFGMTGSGKTGLCVCLLEEALIDGIPVIAIDPKGDLGNLLLNFPNLEGGDFEPWVQESAAKQKGLSTAEFAANQAALWKKGLGEWGQSGERVGKLRAAADMAIYTPGSEAGLPVSMLRSFEAPSEELRRDREQMRDRVQAAAGSLLGMVGVDADPVRSREHILLSLILDKAWSAGQSLSVPEVIQQIQKPPVERVGVFDLESFYPAKDRFELAMAINNLLASPGFEAWMTGEPLDLDRMLYTAEGKPRLAIFSIAHLGDAERMFFVSTLLGETLSWMRRQSGTASLRALLYMDEIYGYLPPTANPPSKQPLMTLMKQARAFGLGVVLSTQNPKDLDYKALSNAGTWFIGRLQTDRDRDRVLDGLEGAALGAGAPFDRAEMERRIASLDKRVFLLYSVHEQGPAAFHTRWALSYLPGPLTREQIERLMAERKASTDKETAVAAAPAIAAVAAAKEARPQAPEGVAEYFAPARTLGAADAKLVYEPALYAAARVFYIDGRRKIEFNEDVCFTTPIEDSPTPVDWLRAEPIELAPDGLESEPTGAIAASYTTLPAEAARAKSYSTWEKRFVSWIYAERRLSLYESPSLGERSQPGESERDFRIRMEQLAREERDRRAEDLRERYGKKLATLEDRVRRAAARVEKEEGDAGQRTMESVLSVGSTLLGALFGRKALSATNVRRMGTAARSFGRVGKERGDVARAKEELAAQQEQLREVETELERELADLEDRVDPLAEELDVLEIKPRKSEIQARLTALVWLPFWRKESGERQPAWR